MNNDREQTNQIDTELPLNLKSDLQKSPRMEEEEAEARTRQAIENAKIQNNQITEQGKSQNMENSHVQIMDKLKADSSFEADFRLFMKQIMIHISEEDYKNNIDQIKREVQGMVTGSFPERDEDLTIMILCDDESQEQMLTIYKPD